MSDADPRCPECGEPIGGTATYCMHCSADLTDERNAADADGDRAWDDGATGGGDADVPWGTDDANADADPDPTWGPDADGGGTSRSSALGDGEPMLDPDGLVDNSLTVIVGIAGGLVVGVVGTIALAIMTDSGWGFLLGIVAWLGSTAYLVRRRTVQGAVAKSGYAVAVVLLLVPLIAFSPLVDVSGGLRGRLTSFLLALFIVLFPAGFAAGLGYVAAQFVPDEAETSEDTEEPAI
jgi:hypothetical protein